MAMGTAMATIMVRRTTQSSGVPAVGRYEGMARGRLTPRSLGIMLAATLLAVPTTLVTVSLLKTRSDPANASALWSHNSLALGEFAADAMVPGASPADLEKGRRAAVKALAIEPGNVNAARALGILYGLQNREGAAVRALLYGEAMSRRDLPTQMALIEWRVQKGDIVGALHHYDRALRTTQSISILLSTMISASADPAIRREVLELLSKQPPWRSAFLVQLIDEQTPPDTVYGIVSALRLNPANSSERQVLSAAINKLIGQGRVADARRLIAPVSSPVRNPDFEEENLFPPLDWALVDEATLNAVIENGPAAYGQTLYLDARNGRSGTVASQWLSLAPGRYQLSLAFGDVTGDALSRPQLSLTCDGAARSVLMTTSLPPAPAEGRAGALGMFSVPTGCAAQLLAISLPASLDGAAPKPWLDKIHIAPR